MEVYEHNCIKAANSKWLFVPVIGFFYYVFARNNSFITNTVYFYFNDNGERTRQKMPNVPENTSLHPL